MKNFKVLCLDGGGIRGLYAATILRLLEDDLRANHSQDARIVDFADLICGTSTGGIIALALALRVPAASICHFYEEAGPQIFRGSQGFWALVRQTCFGGKFSDRDLRAALKEVFGESTIGDSQCLLCVPTFDVTNCTYGIFKYDHLDGGLSRHNRLPVVEVALATSAAPTFFPLARVELENNTQYVDGGVWANNPSLVGLTEALWHFAGPGKSYDSISLLSIAALAGSVGQAPLLKPRRSFLRWRSDLFELGLVGQSEFTDVLLQQMQKWQLLPLSYTRIQSAEIRPAHRSYLKLDRADQQSISLIKQYATDMYHRSKRMPGVATFFGAEKTYQVSSPTHEFDART